MKPLSQITLQEAHSPQAAPTCLKVMTYLASPLNYKQTAKDHQIYKEDGQEREKKKEREETREKKEVREGERGRKKKINKRREEERRKERKKKELGLCRAIRAS